MDRTIFYYFAKIKFTLASSTTDNKFLLSDEKQDLKLIPINPNVCFATTTSVSSIKNSNQTRISTSCNLNTSTFVPMIDLHGKKYFPVYLNQPSDDKDQINTNKSIPPAPPLLKSNVYLERLVISQIGLVPTKRDRKPFEITKNHEQHVKKPSNVVTQRPSEVYKNQRAKTIRVGKICWPPPLYSEETENINQQKQILVQRRIQDEIHTNEQLSTIQDENIVHDQKSMLGKENFQQHDNQSSFVDLKVNTQEKIPSIILPTIIDENEPVQKNRTFSDDIYDRLDYQTFRTTKTYSNCEQLSIKSTKRRHHHTNKKRLHRRCAPTYIKELKAYLAHRESSISDIVKISDVKKFNNVLVWLSNQTTSPSLIETSIPTPISLIKTDNPTPTFTDEAYTSKSSSRQSLSYLTYDNIQWKLKIRKEVFSPGETFDEPTLIELLYLQILHDLFSLACIRINDAERTNMKIFLSTHGIVTIGDINLIEILSTKKTIIEQARQWSIYFCRLFPISIPKIHSNVVQILGISHSGIRLIKQNRTTTTNGTSLKVFKTYSFDVFQHVSSVQNDSTIDLCLKKKTITIHSHQIQKIKQMIDKFLKEFQTNTNKQSQVVPNQIITTTTPSDLFKSSSQTSLMSCSQTFSELIPSTSVELHTPKPTLSILPTGYSMMEFALQNFKLPNKRRSKKSWKTSEWTWQDYADLIKWSETPIQTPLLRHSSNNSLRISRQCFLAIMRFMGDYPMARDRTEINYVIYLLKNMHKHRILIDEVLCQIIKQLTDNKSIIIDSMQRGWKLLAIILNYFIPSDHLKPYFLKYLHDNQNHDEKLVKLCLNHYEQTLKYGGRKTIPNKTEIDLITNSGENTEKRQIFLLPGGFPLTISITSSMVIADCLNLLCEQFNISNVLESSEYSIFIISASKYSSRLLNLTEYLFDIFNDCIRLNIDDFHLIIKRMLWFTIPFQMNHDDKKSEIFIDFMYHQLIPEFLDGTMIILNNNNNLSDDLMQEISFMVALQYRASNKTDLPSIKEIKYLLPANVLKLKDIHPQQWTIAIHDKFNSSVAMMSTTEAKMKFLDLIQTWPLFGTTFFTVQSIDNSLIRSPCLIGLCKTNILFLDFYTRETMSAILYNDIVSIRRYQSTIDIKYESLNQIHILQCKLDKAQDFVALIERYLSLIGRTVT
ncbi:unnamed protein product [Adineta steineri]|uniref:MyTH4 domain-containing protein n=1 Tax=Adineta steineri TaxID=433720 RepID=A0A814EUX4_9BILA|nr:unnamed protein product [Adineta steineri]CAF1098369.1 unnamed protein product [Adineta steineri]